MKTFRSCLAPAVALAACACLALAPLALVGCGSSGSTATGSPTASPTPTPGASIVTPANVKLAASLATANALTFVNPEDQKPLAADVSSAAHALRTLATGAAPSVDQVQATIRQFGGPTFSPGYRLLAGNLAALYSSVYPSLASHGDAAANAKAIAFLEALAEGAEDGAAPYL